MSNEDNSEINIIYNIYNENIKIFGYEFIKNNRNICKMIINNKDEHVQNKLLILVTLMVFNFEISGKYDKDEHVLNI